MDRYAHDLGLWGQAHPGNEPIYCDGPLPLNTDAIIYPGSDDEADEATRLARIQRYEECGRRYLQGRPLRILSASLRGPFDKSSGWRNPWLPNLPSDYARHERPSQQPAPATTVQESGSIQPSSLTAEGDDTMEDGDVQDSMECHLPSPQSHEDLQFFDSSSQLERRSRVESWANGVDGNILEKDKFWAPGYSSVDRDGEFSQKRPAGKDWLKRRPAKKRRLPASQTTGATFNSTPTPMTRSGSKSSKVSALRNRSANRSFEMTTPSSSPDKGPRESPDTVERQETSSIEEYRQPASLDTVAADTETHAEPAISSIQEGEEREGGREEEGDAGAHDQEIKADCGNEDLIANDNKGQSRKGPSYNNIETEETSFEDFADDSFHYRARHLKHPTPTRDSNDKLVNEPSEIKMTETSVSPEPFNAVTSSFGIYNESSCHNTPHELLKSGDMEPMIQLNENPGFVVFNNESHHPTSSALASNESLMQFHEAMFKTCSASTPILDAASVPNIDNGRALSDITSNEHGSRLNVRTQILHTIHEVKEATAMDAGPFLDEGATLVGDVMDMEELGGINAPRDASDDSFSKGRDLLTHYAMSATNLANASQQFYYSKNIALSGTEEITGYAMTSSPQVEPAEMLPLTTTDSNQCPKGEDVTSLFGDTGLSSQNDEEQPLVMAKDQTAVPEQQSPWTSLCTVESTSPILNDNIERREDVLTQLPPPPVAAPIDSSALINDSPAVRPSQQSPWAQETALPNIITDLKAVTSTETTNTTDAEMPVELASPPLPEPQNLWAASSSAPPSILSSPCQMPNELERLEPDVKEDESGLNMQGYPDIPIPHVHRQSTPDGEVSIRTFSNFNFFSPPRQSYVPSNSTCRSILARKKPWSVRSSNKSIRRVLFAPLPHEQDDDSYSPSITSRAVSPPPPMVVDLEQEDDIDGKYRKHFDIMNRRLSFQGTPVFRFHQRLLPSSSHQKPESPSVDAMAEAFREADAGQTDFADKAAEENKAEGNDPILEEADEGPQSPWQHDTQGTDDVAAVMGNIGAFLDTWDVDAEIDRNRAELHEAGTHDKPSINDMGVLYGTGIW
ncbi:hypothetical protein NPX13_g6312 [Xylaria arbuscula]|uniref:Protamine P1 n=1 Tax=Xylaria arbuscula TaxID=114810 RepID=A0A9W8ND41_9PEZI|nr:hypothetical protein NPX13_g6312 [Xylaria arbuscula]